jgi:hypothetical protein
MAISIGDVSQTKIKKMLQRGRDAGEAYARAVTKR